MTYIELINEFWKQNGLMPFTVMDVTVYMYLLHQCNIRQWHNPFQLQTRNLEFDLRISRKQIGESRNRLKQRRLIDFAEGKKGMPASYTIIGISENMFPSETNTATNTATHIETHIETHNKTKIETKTKEKTPKGVKKKTPSPLEQIEIFKSSATNNAYLKFLEWLPENAPYVASSIQPLSESEFEKLKSVYGSQCIVKNILNIENRKDLRKKYVSLYRTLLNWCKNGYND